MPAVRHVQIGGGSVPAIEVQPAESLQRIQTRVAKACNVQPAFVKVSVDGRRAKDLTQVCWVLLLHGPHALFAPFDCVVAMTCGALHMEYGVPGGVCRDEMCAVL